jgi:diguanylate cyclase
MTTDHSSQHHARAASLRRRWNRAFVVLTSTVVLSGVASFADSRVLIGAFRASAVRVERQATITAELRAAVVAHAVDVAQAETADRQFLVNADQATIREGFREAVAVETTEQADALLAQSRDRWEAMVAAADATGSTDVSARGAIVSVDVPEVLRLLDEAGALSRAATRDELAGATRLDHFATAVVSALLVAAILLALRLTRRLSTEILRPVGILRDSANHLAAGHLDHRVPADRPDELGELANSFNTMAEAIARTQRSLRTEATHGALTRLPNRAAFRAEVDAILGRSRGDDVQAVLFVDLDDFKDVNDSQGHAAGDELLRSVAHDLRRVMRPGDVVARLGGDEFAVLVDGLADELAAVHLAERIVQALAEPTAMASATGTSGRASGWHFGGRTRRTSRSCERPTSPCTRPSARARTGSSATTTPSMSS